MVRRRSRAAALVVAFACLPTPAWAQEPTPTPGSQPPLSGDPPTALGAEGDEPAPGPQLPETGAEALLVALAGVGLLGAGTGLRIIVARTGG